MRPRVLVVDDDPLIADTLRLIFAANGFDSQACYSGADAVAKARSFSPALLLCDVTMPGQNGLDVADAISRELPQCHVIMLTAYLNNSDGARFEALHRRRPLKLLNKPCHPEELLREAHLLLGAA